MIFYNKKEKTYHKPVAKSTIAKFKADKNYVSIRDIEKHQKELKGDE